MPRMDESELKAIVAAEISAAVGIEDSELSTDRIDGWDAYLKQPYGNEVDGRSQVVSSDVQDTVEWIMPSLMRIFTAGETAVEFNPQGPEDERAAEQATDYCNYVWDQDNPGFLNFHTWFKDALIAKVGAIKVYWEVKDTWKKERYDGLDENAYALVVSSPDVEIIEHTERSEMLPPAPDMPGEPSMVTLHDVVVRKKTTAGKICVDPVPGDEILFSKDAKDVQSCRFFGHQAKRTVSDLIEQYPEQRKLIEGLSSDGPGSPYTDEADHRSTVNEEDNSPYTSMINKAMREVWVTEAYVRVDYDGDGVAEMRKVTVAGPSSDILDNEDWDGPRPFACLSPILMPHRLVGLSIPDTIKDLQLIKTTMLRMFLDSLYFSLNPRQEVNVDRIVDPSEVLTSKPGGIVRKTGDAPVLTPIVTTPVADTALVGLNYVDQLRENRTGVSPRTQGLGADTLHDTKGGQELLFDAAKMRVELIARVFAETGVKDAFKLILWNANKYQDKERVIRLRNEWVPMDPRQWSDQYDMTANVGLGHNDKAQEMLAINQVIGAQSAAVQMQGGASGPLVTMENLYASAQKLVEAAGLKAPELYFSDPAKAPPQPPKPDPKMIEVQGKLQLEDQKQKMQAASDMQKADADMAVAKYKADQEMQLAKYKADQEMQLAVYKANLEAQLSREQMDRDMALGARGQDVKAMSQVRPGGEVG